MSSVKCRFSGSTSCPNGTFAATRRWLSTSSIRHSSRLPATGRSTRAIRFGIRRGRRGTRVTRGWRRLQSIPTLGVALDEYPLIDCHRGETKRYRISDRLSATRPGPNPSATHGRGALRRRKPIQHEQHRRRRHVAAFAEHLPRYGRHVPRSDRAPSPRRSARAGRPDEPPTTPRPRMLQAMVCRSQRSSHGRRLAAIRFGTRVESVMSKP